jgi:hypothetical protein
MADVLCPDLPIRVGGTTQCQVTKDGITGNVTIRVLAVPGGQVSAWDYYFG